MTRPASYNRVWAGSAGSDQMGGETTTGDQTVITDGWIGTATAAPPTARMQNYWQIRVDLGLQEIERQGFLSWRTDVAYQIGVVVSYAGYLFQAFSANTGVTPQGSSDIGIWSLIQPGKWPTTTDNITGTLPVTKGGTGGTTQAAARSGIGAAASGANSDITSLTGMTTPLSVSQGGTGANSASGARTNLGLGTAATYAAGNTSGQLAPQGWNYALDTGAANAYAAAYSPAIASAVEYQVLKFKALNANTGASTFSPNGLTTAPIVGAAHSALQGGEIVANGDVWVQWNSSIGTGSWVLIDSTGGAFQVANATKSQHAVNAGQLQTGALAFSTDTGTANTYICAFTPAITARTEGQVLRFKVKMANTTASTLNDGLGAAALVGGAHAALQGGELIASGDAWVQWNSSIGGGSYILLFCTGAAEQVAAGTQSQHAIQVGQVQQNYAWNHGFQSITASGNFTVPANVYWLDVEEWGGGGGGGGAGSGGGTAGGGGAPGYCRKIMAVTPGQVIAGVIGAGGIGGGAGGGGSSGGTTTFGGTLSAGGGGGGAVNPSGNGGAGGTASGGDINIPGASGTTGAATNVQGGSGGQTPGGGGSAGGGAQGIAGAGTIPGGAGGGGGSNSSGGNGARGQINIRW